MKKMVIVYKRGQCFLTEASLCQNKQIRNCRSKAECKSAKVDYSRRLLTTADPSDFINPINTKNYEETTMQKLFLW